jgi:hypothetical protein
MIFIYLFEICFLTFIEPARVGGGGGEKHRVAATKKKKNSKK